MALLALRTFEPDIMYTHRAHIHRPNISHMFDKSSMMTLNVNNFTSKLGVATIIDLDLGFVICKKACQLHL